MKWGLAFLALLLALDLGVYLAGPPVRHHHIALPFHPLWLPSVLAPLAPELPETAPIALPNGSDSALGALPPSSVPLVDNLWIGGHSFVVPLGVHQTMAWLQDHTGNSWKVSLTGSYINPGHQTIYSVGLMSRRIPDQTVMISLQSQATGRTMATLMVQTVMIPHRPQDTLLPPNPSAIHIIYHAFHPRQEVVVVTSSTLVARITHQINQGRVVPLGVGDCGAAGLWDATLHFRYRHRSPISVQYAPSCGWALVNGHSSTPIAVNGLYPVIQHIPQQFGLPRMP